MQYIPYLGAIVIGWLLRKYIDNERNQRDCRLINYLDHEFKKTRSEIMSKISEFADKQNAHNDKIDAAISGLTGDIQALNDLIKQLQESNGEITPEDQALLDALDARGQAIETKLEALDALNPPPVPDAS